MMNQNLAMLVSKSLVATIWNQYWQKRCLQHGLSPLEQIISDFYNWPTLWSGDVVERRLGCPDEACPDSAFLWIAFSFCVLKGVRQKRIKFCFGILALPIWQYYWSPVSDESVLRAGGFKLRDVHVRKVEHQAVFLWSESFSCGLQVLQHFLYFPE